MNFKFHVEIYIHTLCELWTCETKMIIVENMQFSLVYRYWIWELDLHYITEQYLRVYWTNKLFSIIITC